MTTQRRISSPQLDVSQTIRPPDGVAGFVLSDGVVAEGDNRDPAEVLNEKLNSTDILTFTLNQATSLFVFQDTKLYLRQADGNYAEVTSKDSGGGGDVTKEQLENEIDLRVAGDRLTFTQITNLAGLDGVLSAQLTSDETYEGIFTEEVTKDSDTYVKGSSHIHSSEIQFYRA